MFTFSYMAEEINIEDYSFESDNIQFMLKYDKENIFQTLIFLCYY